MRLGGESFDFSSSLIYGSRNWNQPYPLSWQILRCIEIRSCATVPQDASATQPHTCSNEDMERREVHLCTGTYNSRAPRRRATGLPRNKKTTKKIKVRMASRRISEKKITQGSSDTKFHTIPGSTDCGVEACPITNWAQRDVADSVGLSRH